MGRKKKEEQKDVFQRIAEHWFLTEPLLFAVYCSHRLTANAALHCVMRSGKGRVEYHPQLIASLQEEKVEEYLKAEMIRILLKHPYDRQPADCPPAGCTLASDCVLSSYYDWQHARLATPQQFHLPEREHYEWYAARLRQLLDEQSAKGHDSTETSEDDPTAGTPEGNADTNKPADNPTTETPEDDVPTGSSLPDPTTGENPQKGTAANRLPQGTAEQRMAEQSALWAEDEWMQNTLNELIENTKSWGSLSGNLQEVIIASTCARIDYRKVLSGFRASIVSTRRSLTRMRPNRRTGFQNMGSLYRFRTRLLVAVDVSGSVDSRTLAHFYSVIGRFFRYGVEQIDTVQFDCAVGPVETLRHASTRVLVTGRGGTDFQCVIDLAHANGPYDGLIVLTDGNAPPPVLPPHFRPHLLWVCEDDHAYRRHHEWMERTGRVCTMYL